MKILTNHLTVLLLVSSSFLFAQNSNKTAYVWFDNIIGQKNLAICSGERYVRNYRVLKGHHPFLWEDQFYYAKVKFDEQIYYNIPVKLDIYKDELIAYFLTHIDKYPIILLKDKVPSFQIDEKKFENLKGLGYHHLLAEKGTSKLYRKYTKQKSLKVKNDLAHYKFKNQGFYRVFHNNTYSTVSSKRDWKRLFPSKKKQIRTFYAKHKKLRKRDTNLFMTNLFNELFN